jgi:hypothetical protein
MLALDVSGQLLKFSGQLARHADAARSLQEETD